MALVMLPCDLPWWTSVQRHLKHLLLASSTDKLINGMLKIHEMCNVSLDPEEDHKDDNLFKEFATFLEEELTPDERGNFMDNTLRIMIQRALNLKRWKPEKGLLFSLQQQGDVTELDHNFISSLIAHAFFSTFPKRTRKTHPTLQDFNFTHFFKNLHRKSQRFKLKSLFYYFEWLDQHSTVEGKVKITRQVSQYNVMSSRQWLTIDDWQECALPLCKLIIRHESRPERCENDDAIRVCFASSRLGGEVLMDGESQESLLMFMMPELLAAMLSVEALEDNEVLKVEGARMFTRLIEPKHKGNLERLEQPKTLSVCLMDAENFSLLPIGQWEEDNVLRELNKSLLGFKQSPKKQRSLERRLSPIGESISITPEVEATVIIKQTSCSTLNSFGSRSPSPDAYTAETLNQTDASIGITRSKCFLDPEQNTLNNRRGRFIVLGSSGERLPVTRSSKSEDFEEDSLYSSCNSSDDEFHSANGSLDEESEDEGRGASGKPNSARYMRELSSDVRRMSFASRLRESLRRDAQSSTATEDWSSNSSSYAVGISISGPRLEDPDIQLKRGGSVGFVLTEKGSEIGEPHFATCVRRDTGNSSKYSFSTDYTSELDEVYDQLNQWLDDPVIDAESGEKKQRELDSRDLAVIRFAGSLLKRTLSESFAGMPLTEGCANTVGMETETRGKLSKHKLALTARSLSLELAKHKHRLASQLNNNVPDFPESIEEESFDTSSSNCTVNTVIHKEIEKCETNNNENSHRKSLKSRKRKLNLIVRLITETIEQTIECEPVTLRLPKAKLSQLAHKIVSGGECRPIATGNWGCGRRLKGNPQLKFMLQWLAASVAGVPALIYYTVGNEQLYKLDTLVRVVVDRKWTVGELTSTVLRYAHQTLHEPQGIPEGHTLFDEVIGIEKCSFDED